LLCNKNAQIVNPYGSKINLLDPVHVNLPVQSQPEGLNTHRLAKDIFLMTKSCVGISPFWKIKFSVNFFILAKRRVLLLTEEDLIGEHNGQDPSGVISLGESFVNRIVLFLS